MKLKIRFFDLAVVSTRLETMCQAYEPVETEFDKISITMHEAMNKTTAELEALKLVKMHRLIEEKLMPLQIDQLIMNDYDDSLEWLTDISRCEFNEIKIGQPQSCS